MLQSEEYESENLTRFWSVLFRMILFLGRFYSGQIRYYRIEQEANGWRIARNRSVVQLSAEITKSFVEPNLAGNGRAPFIKRRHHCGDALVTFWSPMDGGIRRRPAICSQHVAYHFMGLLGIKPIYGI